MIACSLRASNGNTLSGGGRTMTWDSQNRMVSCAYNGNTLTFDYGSDGLRRSETLTSGGQSITTYYVYDGQSLVMEETRNAQGQLVPSASYLNGPRGPEYKKDETTGLVKWYLYDGLGSVIGEVDPSGNVTYSAKYDIYGAGRATTGTATSAQGFVGGCGHLSEAATGLIYMRARYYDPNTGRFVSQDPEHSGSNWFSYCHNNPINHVDRTGKDDMAEEMEANGDAMSMDENDAEVDVESLRAYIKGGGPPDEITGIMSHAWDEFDNAIADKLGGDSGGKDLNDLVLEWDPSKAEAGNQDKWICEVQWRNVVLTMVADDTGDLITVY